MRRVASTVLLVVAGVMLPVAVIANWAGSNLYDSDSFSARAVEPLNSEAVRTELARRLTEQLVQAGNQQATSFRPAFELALEGVIDTDTFKSIFRNAVRQTHKAILEGDGGRRGLDARQALETCQHLEMERVDLGRRISGCTQIDRPK